MNFHKKYKCQLVKHPDCSLWYIKVAVYRFIPLWWKTVYTSHFISAISNYKDKNFGDYQSYTKWFNSRKNARKRLTLIEKCAVNNTKLKDKLIKASNKRELFYYFNKSKEVKPVNYCYGPYLTFNNRYTSVALWEYSVNKDGTIKYLTPEPFNGNPNSIIIKK